MEEQTDSRYDEEAYEGEGEANRDFSGSPSPPRDSTKGAEVVDLAERRKATPEARRLQEETLKLLDVIKDPDATRRERQNAGCDLWDRYNVQAYGFAYSRALNWLYDNNMRFGRMSQTSIAKDIAADALGECFAELVIIEPSKYKPEGKASFKTFLYNRIEMRVHSMCRRLASKFSGEKDLEEASSGSPDIADSKIEVECLKAALLQLDPDEREVVYRYHCLDQTYDEIAREIGDGKGPSIATVSRRRKSAEAKIKRFMDDVDDVSSSEMKGKEI